VDFLKIDSYISIIYSTDKHIPGSIILNSTGVSFDVGIACFGFVGHNDLCLDLHGCNGFFQLERIG